MYRLAATILLSLPACICGLYLKAQTHQAIFKNIGVNEGLSHSSVYALLQDKKGYIWAGTADGLNRYDGHKITVYRPEETQRNPDAAYIRDKIVEDSSGNIWFANSAGIYCYNARLDKILRKKVFKNLSIVLYEIDAAGNLWMEDVGKKILSYNTRTGRLRSYPFQISQSSIELSANASDGGENLWFACNSQTIHRFNIKSKKFSHFDAPFRFMNMAYGNGKLWLMNGDSFCVADPETLKPLAKFTLDAPIRQSSLAFDKQNNIWITTYRSGLYCLSPGFKILRHYRHDNHLPLSIASNITTRVFIDRSDNLWIGTDGAGISHISLKPGALKKFPKDERDYPQLSDFFIKSFYEDKTGKLYFSTYASGLNIFDTATEKVQHIDFSFSSAAPLIINTIFIEGEKIWLGHDDGLSYITKDAQTLSAAASEKKYTVLKIEKLPTGELILATSEGARIVAPKGKEWKDITAFSPPYRTIDMLQDTGNIMWLVTPHHGLLQVARINDSLILKSNFLKSQNLRSVHRDGRDSTLLWLASQKGLVRFSTRTYAYKIFDTKDGIANAHIYGVLEDENNNLWMSTNGGLTCLEKNRKTFKNYNYKNGLQSNEFNSGAFYKSISGKLYFGGVKGFNWFTGAGMQSDTSQPQLAINYFKANDSVLIPSAYAKDATVRLPHDLNFLNLDLSVLDFMQPEANMVQYKLEGWDKDWTLRPPGEIRYSNLPPGNYTLHVFGIGSNKTYSAEYRVRIHIIAPFWQRPVFQIGVILFILALIFGLAYLRHRQKMKRVLQEIERQRMLAAERNRISEDLHDEIGSAITKISLLSEQMPQQLTAEHTLIQDINTISSTARKVAQSMSEIIWTLHSQHEQLETLLAYIREQSREFLQPLGIQYTIDFPDDVPSIKLSGEQRHNLFLVTKEAINNAVKYAQADCISISCHIKEQQIVFNVMDNGIGFIASRTNTQGNGLKNMQRRMAAINGTISWQQPGKGTCVRYSIPL